MKIVQWELNCSMWTDGPSSRYSQFYERA